jgi:hypothetical protein
MGLLITILTLGMLAGNAGFQNVQAESVTLSKPKPALPVSRTRQKIDQRVARIRPGFHQTFIRTKQKTNLLINARSSAVQECSIASCTFSSSSAPLPVTLVEFSGKRLDQSQVQLSWTTSAEVNNDYFQVERTLNPAEGFQSVGLVKGKGTSSQNVFYQLTDPNKETVYTYYRLMQVDLDGSTSYSRIIAVKGYNEELSLSAFPNPAPANDLKFQVSGSKTGEILSVLVYDLEGKAIYKNDRYAVGENQQISLPVPRIESGSYVIKIKSTQQQASASFIIVH